MSENLDTRTVSLDEPLSEGIVKLLNDEERWEPEQPERDTTASDISADDYFSISQAAREPRRAHGWFGLAATKFSRGIVAGFIATHIAVSRLSSNCEWTATLDPYSILNPERALGSHVAGVSAGLIMPREEVRESSLLAPSGAYLTWIEMRAETLDDEES